MTPITIWLVAYLCPAFVVASFIRPIPKAAEVESRRLILAHGALILSAFASQYAIHNSGFVFPWYLSLVGIGAYFVGIFVAVGLMGLLGAAYALSALIQQIALLSIAFLLLAAYPTPVVMLLLIPPYVLCHQFSSRRCARKALLLAIWGSLCIGIFVIIPNLWIIAGLHAALGAFLLTRSVL